MREIVLQAIELSGFGLDQLAMRLGIRCDALTSTLLLNTLTIREAQSILEVCGFSVDFQLVVRQSLVEV